MKLRTLGKLLSLLAMIAGPLAGCAEEKHSLEVCPDTPLTIGAYSYEGFTLTDQNGTQIPGDPTVVKVNQLTDLEIGVFHADDYVGVGGAAKIATTLSWQEQGFESVTLSTRFGAYALDRSLSPGELISDQFVDYADCNKTYPCDEREIQYRNSAGETRILRSVGVRNADIVLSLDLESYRCELSCGQGGAWAECHERHCDYKCDNGLEGKFKYNDGCGSLGDGSALMKQLPATCQINGMTVTSGSLTQDVPVVTN